MRPRNVYYGWIIVAVMATTGALSMAMGTLNFGLFIKPMGDDLGIGRATFGWAQTVRQGMSALTSPIVGGLIDRFGSRVLLAVSAGITGVALAALSLTQAGWQIVALFAVMGVVGMSGPGALVTTVPVAKWFVRQRGKAMSYMSLGIPLGAVIFAPLSYLLIEAFGWRTAWVILAAIGAGLVIPLSLIFIRRQPEDMGLLPDGDPPHGERAVGSRDMTPLHVEERSWTREEAMRTVTFWKLAATFSIVMLGISSVGVHRIPHFMDKGLDPGIVSLATALDAICAGISMFTIGMLGDRVAPRYLGALGFCILSVAIFLTIIGETVPVMFLAMITFGFGIGGLVFLQNYLWAAYFGRVHLGSIRGTVMPITLLFGGIGAPLAGYVHDATGTYSGIWAAGLVLMLVGAVVLVFTPPPRREAPLDEPVPVPALPG
jgi:MFS family permease